MVADQSVPTSGYKLYRDGGNDGNFEMIYNGVGSPGQL
jgi:hypothetical protein